MPRPSPCPSIEALFVRVPQHTLSRAIAVSLSQLQRSVSEAESVGALSPHAVSGIHDEIATLGNRLASEIMPLSTPVETPAEPATTEAATETPDVTSDSSVTEAPAEPATTEAA